MPQEDDYQNMSHSTKRALKKTFTSFLLLIAMTMTLLAYVPPVAAGSSSYSENFMTTTYKDAAATSATGWGSGALQLPPKWPSLLGMCNMSGSALWVELAGCLAYVADGASGLRVVNVTNPRQPNALGIYNTPGTAQGVTVAGGIAYVADQDGGLQVINVTDPRNPALLGNYVLVNPCVWCSGGRRYRLHRRPFLGAGCDKYHRPTTPYIAGYLWHARHGVRRGSGGWCRLHR